METMFKLTYKKAGKVAGTYYHTKIEAVSMVAVSMLKNDIPILGCDTYMLLSQMTDGYRNEELDISITIHDESA